MRTMLESKTSFPLSIIAIIVVVIVMKAVLKVRQLVAILCRSIIVKEKKRKREGKLNVFFFRKIA